MKKAQVQTQVFIYVLALIVVSLIMLYGYNSIKKIREHTVTVEHIQFKTDVENTIKRIGYEFGSIEKKTFDVPSSYKEVCFVDSNIDPNNNNIPQNEYPVINNSVATNASDNVFLVTNIAEESFYVGEIEVENDFLCFNVSRGKVRIQLEALGSKVRVSEP